MMADFKIAKYPHPVNQRAQYDALSTPLNAIPFCVLVTIVLASRDYGLWAWLAGLPVFLVFASLAAYRSIFSWPHVAARQKTCSPPETVTYIGAAPEQIAWRGCADPRGTLEENRRYVVEDKKAGRSYCEVKLLGIDGWYSSVFFDGVKFQK